MEVHDAPYPDYRDAGEVPTHDYRVVFWTHQSPPPGYSAEGMGWAEVTVDVSQAQDVHEVIEWAESYLAEIAESYPGQAHTYCLYAKVPDETWMLHLAGVNPSAHPDGETFRRMHPFDGR